MGMNDMRQKTLIYLWSTCHIFNQDYIQRKVAICNYLSKRYLLGSISYISRNRQNKILFYESPIQDFFMFKQVSTSTVLHTTRIYRPGMICIHDIPIQPHILPKTFLYYCLTLLMTWIPLSAQVIWYSGIEKYLQTLVSAEFDTHPYCHSNGGLATLPVE